jgi:hypothetical protein
LKNEGHGLGPEIDKNLYVDDLLLDCVDKEEAKIKSRLAQQIFEKAKMRLCSFVALDMSALDVPESDWQIGENPSVLGLKWNLEKDLLALNLPSDSSISSKIPTRRSVLSHISMFFDPLGLCCPITVRAKLFFQSLWGCGKKWDEPLDSDQIQNWNLILSDLGGDPFLIPRLTPAVGEISLHVFTDAGPEAYGAAVYLRSLLLDGSARVDLVYAKSRLRPYRMKNDGLTIPRLELLGILIGVRAKDFVRNSITQPIHSEHIWVDSQIALSWLETTGTLDTFVHNRVTEIRKHRSAKFHYIRSNENPADLCARGTTSPKLKNLSLWFHGPGWLSAEESS